MDKERTTVYMDTNLKKRVQVYGISNNTNMTNLIHEALERHMDILEKEQEDAQKKKINNNKEGIE